MKVSPTSSIQPVEPVKGRPERAAAGSSPPQDTVTLSSSTSFVEKAREAARAGPQFRHDVVAEVRESIANGSFEKSIDFDAAMDSLLADL